MDNDQLDTLQRERDQLAAKLAEAEIKIEQQAEVCVRSLRET